MTREAQKRIAKNAWERGRKNKEKQSRK